MPRPRGAGRGLVRAAIRQSRYQEYYNRGTNAAWQAQQEDDTTSLLKFFSLACWASALVLFALIPTGTMIVLLTPLWVGGLLCGAMSR